MHFTSLSLDSFKVKAKDKDDLFLHFNNEITNYDLIAKPRMDPFPFASLAPQRLSDSGAKEETTL